MCCVWGGLHSTDVAFFLITQHSTFPEIYFDLAEVSQRHWFEESAQRLENVDQSHLVLSSGKLVLQKDAMLKRGLDAETAFTTIEFRVNQRATWPQKLRILKVYVQVF